MEVKVYVEGVQRIVCGVTEKTTCQEVVIALARALGRTGRYTLREQFKEYERNVSPDEYLLKSLQKYGEHAKDVQLILKLVAPSLGEDQTKAQMRQVDALGKARKDTGVISPLHRQSLPPLSRLYPHTEQPLEQLKQPKRKSLTLMEEAWGWLENLGRGGRQDSGRDKESNKGSGRSDNRCLKPTKSPLTSRTPQMREKRSAQPKPLISCLGNRGRCHDVDDVQKGAKQDLKAINQVVPLVQTSFGKTEDEISEIRRLVIKQQADLQDLQQKIGSTDKLICELEQLQTDTKFSESLSEEEEQLRFWLNELKAEEVFEKDLQNQFFQIKEAAAECKAKLEEYNQKLLTMGLKTSVEDPAKPGTKRVEISEKRLHEVTGTKRVVTTLESKLPYIFVSANQLSSQSGPEDLREWWSGWSKSHNQSVGKPKTIHRSEITIQLGGTRV
ncbi:hypothetical protein DNTS_020507 [Danionella cerebrum]|uniref:Ras-associating domain-containing protein n=1 Tax=Danionella cerebrum TaxID=2873325 RepID=A0A553QJ09_9TELE|nr:hypothetical protein DNTS_020507 [Danionella translucida]